MNTSVYSWYPSHALWYPSGVLYHTKLHSWCLFCTYVILVFVFSGCPSSVLNNFQCTYIVPVVCSCCTSPVVYYHLFGVLNACYGGWKCWLIPSWVCLFLNMFFLWCIKSTFNKIKDFFLVLIHTFTIYTHSALSVVDAICWCYMLYDAISNCRGCFPSISTLLLRGSQPTIKAGSI